MAADYPEVAWTVTSEEEDQENTPFVENLSQAEAGEVLLCLGQISRKMRAKSVLVRREASSSAAESLFLSCYVNSLEDWITYAILW